MSFIFLPLIDIKYKGLETFYKKIIIELHKIGNFKSSDFHLYKETHIYYYDSPDFALCQNKKHLGKFKGNTKINTDILGYYYDYDAYEFENASILTSNTHLIYCEVIPDTDTNMVYIPDITYQEKEIYYKKA
jgi:hypothetical protein